jgi:NitT/TauT family transport system substrate-binding protein
MIMEEHPDEFRVLSWVGPDEVVTDEALFARLDWLQENEEQVGLLLDELLKSAKEICANPAMIAEERKKYDLLPDLPQELADGLADYYVEAIEAGVYSCDGGNEQAARTDIAVLSQSGQLEGSPDELKVEDFWYFEPLEAAKEKVDMSGG